MEWSTTITVFDICHTVWRPAWLIKGTIIWHLHLFCGYDNSYLIRLGEISCPLGARSVTLNHSFRAPNYSHSNPHQPLLSYHTYRHTHTQPPLTSAHSSLPVNCAINRSWCPDRTMAQARKYIAESMGSNYAENVILDLEKTWEESDNRTPLINFLSMGSDPTSLIENLAKRHKFGTYNISLCKMVFYEK